MTYQPQPLPTSGIQLDGALLALTERLAEHNHDVWAAQRIKDGWSHGPQRDDVRKQHPSLVPYRTLPESEKQYDRNAALETLRGVLALGWRIEKP